MLKNLTVAERLNLNPTFGLKQFELGSVIAKGNNAVVYEARKIEEDEGNSLVVFIFMNKFNNYTIFLIVCSTKYNHHKSRHFFLVLTQDI